MRWMWIDRIVELVPGERMVAIKHVSLAEDHLHDHFEAEDGLEAQPIMPASLIIEGMAQTAGILVGHARDFREKVILAKIGTAELPCDASPGQTIRFTAVIDRIDDAGAVTSGTVEILDPPPFTSTAADTRGTAIKPTASTAHNTSGRIELLFSHIDQNMAGVSFPKHNFVFSETFRTLLRTSGIDAPF